jgi:hypothetical protein
VGGWVLGKKENKNAFNGHEKKKHGLVGYAMAVYIYISAT